MFVRGGYRTTPSQLGEQWESCTHYNDNEGRQLMVHSFELVMFLETIWGLLEALVLV